MNEDQKTTSFVTFNILLQDGKLKTTTINNKTYLYEIVEKKRNKILKVNLLDMTFTKGKLVFNYPLEIIKVQNKDYIVIEKNNAFYKCHDSEKNIPIILYKT
jgi:hypothetical protein